MKRSMLAATTALAFALAACGDKTATSNTTTQITNDTTTTLVPPPDDLNGAATNESVGGGQDFANRAAASDAFEIASSKLAADKASSAKVKAFAAQMIKAHEGSTAKLKATAAALVPAFVPDATLNPAQQARLDDLATKSGSDFDKAYADAQVEAHQDALDALKDYVEAGDVPELKSFASGLVPTVTAHLNMAKGLQP